MELEKKSDPLTGEEFTPKKISQKFAKPENRIRYNNIKASKLNKERAFFDKPCKKTHIIIKELYSNGPGKSYHYYFLEGKGVDFKAYNHMVDTDYGRAPAYYDYALIETKKKEFYQIIKL